MDNVEFNFDESDIFQIEEGNNDSKSQITFVDKKKKKQKLPIKKMREPRLTRSVPKMQQRPMSTVNSVPMTPRPQPPTFHDKTFEAFGNPSKMRPESPDVSDDEEEEEALSENNFPEDVSDMGNNMNQDDNDVEPEAGFATIEDEKEDILYKFHRLESKGIKLQKKFNMYSDIKEMRSEYKKVTKDADAKSSIKFSRQMLMTCVSGLEFLNKRYDPVGAELNGWSETVMENMNDGDYDNVFERLHDKYGGKVDAPPEIELLLTLGGSAIMFHMTSTMFKSVPNLGDMARQNPDIQNAMKNMADSLMKAQMGGGQNDAPVNNSGQPEMKGPSMNLSSMGSMFGGGGPPPPEVQSFRNGNGSQNRFTEHSDVSISDSETSTISVKKVSVAISETGSRRGRKPKINATKENTIDI